MANTLRSEGDSAQADRADSVANAVRANLAGEE